MIVGVLQFAIVIDSVKRLAKIGELLLFQESKDPAYGGGNPLKTLCDAGLALMNRLNEVVKRIWDRVAALEKSETLKEPNLVLTSKRYAPSSRFVIVE